MDNWVSVIFLFLYELEIKSVNPDDGKVTKYSFFFS